MGERQMKKWIKLSGALAVLAGLSLLSGCATVRTSNAAICRIQFDYRDAGIEALNDQNLRALVAFKEVCDGR